MKTKTEYEPDRKKGKARPPKIAEFTVSISEGVSERFKVSVPSCRDGLQGTVTRHATLYLDPSQLRKPNSCWLPTNMVSL